MFLFILPTTGGESCNGQATVTRYQGQVSEVLQRGHEEKTLPCHISTGRPTCNTTGNVFCLLVYFNAILLWLGYY